MTSKLASACGDKVLLAVLVMVTLGAWMVAVPAAARAAAPPPWQGEELPLPLTVRWTPRSRR